MAILRLALAQVNPTVGNISGNTELIKKYCRQAHEAGAQLVVFGEMALTGYPIEDLVYRESFVHASQQAVTQLAVDLAGAGLGELTVIVGYLDTDGPLAPGQARVATGGPRNAAAILQHGKVIDTYFKHYLPTYGVFDEDRYFVPGERLSVIQVAGVDIATVICEDIWRAGYPIEAARQAGVDLVICINGSPYEQNKDDFRQQLCAQRASEVGAPLAYVNLVGGQDELVFDGDSMIVAPNGELLARAPQFNEHLLIVDLPFAGHQSEANKNVAPITDRPLPAKPVAALLSDEEEIWQALTMGLRDYVNKNGFASVILGLSGGIDSALCAALACDALGSHRVYGVSMPSAYSSVHSREDAAELARRTGLQFRTIPIADMVVAYQESLKLTGLAEENLQARVRGTLLMGLSNQEGHLVLAPGNKSEYAVGYSTLYGDAVGGFAPIKDVLKTLVRKLALWRNQQANRLGETAPIPENSISKPPSAELRPGQLDTDSLPDYPILDAILADYIDHDRSRSQLLKAGHNSILVDKVVRLVDAAEYKRRQSAPGTKITLKAFGRDRRLPMTNRWQEK